MPNRWEGPLRKLDDYRWEIPKSYKEGMRVPGIIYADERILEVIRGDQAPEQVANVAFLPGIVRSSMAMPDIHWGYGFPIGGVAATRVEDGVISPGGVGFDINCGVRLLYTRLSEEEVRPRIGELVDELFASVPSGLGSEGKIRLRSGEIDDVLVGGARWAVEKGYGEAQDIEVTEENGQMKGADPAQVSERAKKRGVPQLGTLGAGNHFIEIDRIDQISRYRYMEHCVIIGRGFNYSTAYEISLKIKELTRVISVPHSSADFNHGPIAAVNHGFPIFVVAPSGKMFDHIIDFTNKLINLKAELIIITDNRQMLKYGKVNFKLPDGIPEWLSPITSIIPGQLFARQLAIEKGYDSDEPEGLLKVTKTY